jgi:type IV pilus assembly protein PilM
MHLGKRRLGSIAVAITGADVSLREVTMPPLSPAELRQALHFEAKKHLAVEEMANPIVGFQILGSEPSQEQGEADQIRVLFAAAPKSLRDFPLQVLAQVGLDPEVVDLEPLAGLNALLGVLAASDPPKGAVGLLDVGARQTQLHITQVEGGVLTRSIGRGVDRAITGSEIDSYISSLAVPIQETITFYRGRFRKEVTGVYLCGGGALIPGIARAVGEHLGLSVSPFNPLNGLAKGAKGIEDSSTLGPRFATACGLCRWWDENLV